MSTDKFTKNEIYAIIERLKQVFCVDTEGKVAESLGIGKSALSQQKARGTLPIERMVTECSQKGINVNWLLTGEGPMFTDATMAAKGIMPGSHQELARRAPFHPAQNGIGRSGNAPAPSNVAPGPPITRRVPLISSVQAGSWTEIIDNFQPGDAEDWIDITSKVGPLAFALHVVGNSMELEFREGELVIVDPDREAESGDYVVAKINDYEATFKQLIRDGGEIYLRPLNSDYPIITVPHDKEFKIVGRVVEKVKRY